MPMPMVMVLASGTLLSRCSLVFSVCTAILKQSPFPFRSFIAGTSAFSVAPGTRRPFLSSTSSFVRRAPSPLSLHRLRGGSDPVVANGRGSRPLDASSADGNTGEGEARTGWLHNTEPKQYHAPDPDADTSVESSIPESAPSNFGGASSVAGNNNDTKGEEDEPPTGWLHNTEPKQYSAQDVYPDFTDESSSTTMEQKTFVGRTFDERMNDYRNHRIIGPPSAHPCGDDKKRMMVTEHKVAVPLCHPDLESAAAVPSDDIIAVDRVDAAYRDDDETFERRPTIDVYFTVIELLSDTADEEFAAHLSNSKLSPRQRADKYVQRGKTHIDASRMMAYLQGGPGFGCAAPVSGLSLASSKSSWASTALFGDITNLDGKTFERVVLMDQRGTGRSSPITKQRLRKMFPDLFLPDDGSPRARQGVEQAAEYLTKFRADSIVRDAEWIKDALISGASASADATLSPPQPWGAALGQSFGGFCLMTYLSSVARPPQMCLFTGGIAPMDTPAREVYNRLWLRVRERNHRYYERFPGDVALVKRIVRRLVRREDGGSPARLPSGGILTARRFLQLGLALGGSPGAAFANLHSIVGSAFLDDDDDDGEISAAFLKRIDYEQSFDDAPLYFLLHESIYADGTSAGATGWAAHTSIRTTCETGPELPYGRQYVSPNPEFDFRRTMEEDSSQPVLFFGEMVFPWMAKGDYAELSGHGMRSLAEALARKADWGPLYHAPNMRAALLGDDGRPPKSKAAGATYYDDMYVDFDCCMKLVQRGAPLEGMKVWVTNEHQHSGLRDDGAAIVCKLVSMAKGSVHVPS